MKWGRSQRQNESAKGKFRKKEEKGDMKTDVTGKTDQLTVEREKSESGQSVHKQNFLWNHWGQQNQRGPWRTRGRKRVQLPNLLFSLTERSFFWDDEDMNTTFPLTKLSFQPVFCNVRTKLLYIKAYTWDVCSLYSYPCYQKTEAARWSLILPVPSIEEVACSACVAWIYWGFFPSEEISLR